MAFPGAGILWVDQEFKDEIDPIFQPDFCNTWWWDFDNSEIRIQVLKSLINKYK